MPSVVGFVRLTDYITSLIGDSFITKSDELEKLRAFKDDKKVLARLDEIKYANKVRFAKIIKKRNGVDINPDSIFDVQVKRLHEYKRQQLNILNIISEYLMLKENPNADYYPKTYIFASKAAPGYFMAKKLIELIDALSGVINNDPDVNGKLKVVFLEDYNVSLAEVLMPAADISEQISLAGTEASGTGNMKLMLNGAVTLGTLDGANVEIHDAVGDDNIYIFGMKTPEVEQLKRAGYFPQSYINNNENLAKAMAFLQSGVNGKRFDEVYYSLVNSDPYMALADFTDYQRAQQEISKAYADREKFVKMSLMNISGAGVFSADRSIRDYADYIWNTKPVQFAKETPKSAKKSAPMAPKKPVAEKKASAKKEEKAPAKKTAKAEKPAPVKEEKKAPAKKSAPKKETPKKEAPKKEAKSTAKTKKTAKK